MCTLCEDSQAHKNQGTLAFCAIKVDHINPHQSNLTQFSGVVNQCVYFVVRTIPRTAQLTKPSEAEYET